VLFKEHIAGHIQDTTRYGSRAKRVSVTMHEIELDLVRALETLVAQKERAVMKFQNFCITIQRVNLKINPQL